MQVPFVVYGVPELEGVVGKWTDEVRCWFHCVRELIFR